MDFFMAFAAVCAYIIKGMCGFANTLVFSTILGFTRNNIHISPVELLLGFPSNLLIARKERRALSARIYLPLSLMVIAGNIPGAFFLKNVDARWMKVIFGFVVAGIGLEMLFRERQESHQGKKGKSSLILLGGIGVLSGLLCGMFGIGALLAAYVSRTTDSNSSFRGNLCVVFLVENIFRIFLYSRLGILSWEVWKLSLGLMPFMALGLVVGMLLAQKCNEKAIRRVVTLMLVLSGISLVAGNF